MPVPPPGTVPLPASLSEPGTLRGIPPAVTPERRPTATAVAAAAAPAPVATPAPAPPAPVPAPVPGEEVPVVARSKAPIAIGVVIAVALAAAGAYLALRPAPRPAAAPEASAPSAPAAKAPEAPPPAPATPAAAEAPPPPAATPAPTAPAPVAPPAPPAAVPAAPPPSTSTATTAPPPAAKAAPRRSEDADLRRQLAAAERKYDTGRFAEAIAEYRKALAIRRTPQALVGLARALYDSNNATEALKTAEEATREDGRYAPAWLLLGEIHNDKGRVAQSRAAYERYLQLEPRGDAAKAVREILARLPR
jgi:tetratricopeptide (TPR) repeat protein